MSNGCETLQLDGTIAKLHYDDAGNPFVRASDVSGNWIPHLGKFLLLQCSRLIAPACSTKFLRVILFVTLTVLVTPMFKLYSFYAQPGLGELFNSVC